MDRQKRKATEVPRQTVVTKLHDACRMIAAEMQSAATEARKRGCHYMVMPLETVDQLVAVLFAAGAALKPAVSVAAPPIPTKLPPSGPADGPTGSAPG